MSIADTDEAQPSRRSGRHASVAYSVEAHGLLRLADLKLLHISQAGVVTVFDLPVPRGRVHVAAAELLFTDYIWVDDVGVAALTPHGVGTLARWDREHPGGAS